MGIPLSSHDHAIGLFYQAECRMWLVMDINQWPPVEALLAAGADPKQAKANGGTPLYTTVLFGHFDVIKALQRHQQAIIAHPPVSIASQQKYPAFVKALLSDETVRDYYLNQIIIKSEFMRDALRKNPVFFAELATHSNEIWARLSGPTHFNLAPDAHKTLLKAILNSAHVPDKTQRHPLHALFSSPQPTGWFSFFNRTANITLDDIQAYTLPLIQVPLHPLMDEGFSKMNR